MLATKVVLNFILRMGGWKVFVNVALPNQINSDRPKQWIIGRPCDHVKQDRCKTTNPHLWALQIPIWNCIKPMKLPFSRFFRFSGGLCVGEGV